MTDEDWDEVADGLASLVALFALLMFAAAIVMSVVGASIILIWMIF